MFKVLKVSALSLISAVSVSHASTVVNIETTTGVAYETVHAIGSTATVGNDLAGMRVTASYGDGSSETLTWEARNIYTLGGTSGRGVEIEMGWQGFEVSASQLMTGLLFEADLGNAVFDMTWAGHGQPGDTPTTGRGVPFEFLNNSDAHLEGTVTAAYSNAIHIVGSEAVGDIYTDMFVDFSALTGGGLMGDVFFRTDLDSLAVAGDLNPSVVPLPATLPLMLAGAADAGGLGRAWADAAQKARLTTPTQNAAQEPGTHMPPGFSVSHFEY